MFAVFETGGRQYKVRVGDEIQVEKLGAEEKQHVTFDKVLLYSKDEKLVTGTPYVEGGQVKATVLRQGKGKKVVVFAHRPRKASRRRRGHRQPFTTVRVTEIIGPRS